MNRKEVEIIVGALAGSLASEVLKIAVEEVKKVYEFDEVFKELKSTMVSLLPIVTQIESKLKDDELKDLMTIITRAREVVGKCSGVHGWDVVHKDIYVRQIAVINSDLLKFCQIVIQLLQFRNQFQSTEAIDKNFQILNEKVDRAAVSPPDSLVTMLEIQYMNFLQCMEAHNKNFHILIEKLDRIADSPPDSLVTMLDIHFKNQLQFTEDMDKNLKILIEKDRPAVSPPVYKDFCLVPTLDFVPVGLDRPLRELKERLLDPAVVSLGVSAPPGCGKTTLVTHLCNDTEIKDKFKHIFFSVASKTPNFRSIVQKLHQRNGNDPRTFDDDCEAKVALKLLLKKLTDSDPVLLVLDDVWHGAEISFLRNFQFDLPHYKILVTSRSRISTLSSTYALETLDDDYARTLLFQWALGPGLSVPTKYDILIQKILKRCNGFPLAIEVVGASLKGKDLHLWEGQEEDWSEGETILDDTTLLNCLQRSFNALKPCLKECFMDMGSFLEDQNLHASVIIDIWVELYGKSHKICMKYLDDLDSQNLLKVTPLGRDEREYGLYNEFMVTQHDLLRELAIRQSKYKEEKNRQKLNLEIRGDNYPDLNLTGPINARLLSISTDDLFSSKWLGMESMDCPDVEALVLNLSSSNYALPTFIATMKKLKVLIIINHGPRMAKLTNLSCLTSLPNLKRIRLDTVSISFLEILQLQLQSLKKLSFVSCIFDDTEAITDVSKALPSLQEIDIDYCYGLRKLPNWVSEVVSLKSLNITNCIQFTKLPKAIGNLCMLEVLRLTSCCSLRELPESAERLINLQFLDISECFELKKLPLNIGNLQKLKKFSMKSCWKFELPDSVTKLKNLVVKCDDEKSASMWKRLESEMTNLDVHIEKDTDPDLDILKLFYV